MIERLTGSVAAVYDDGVVIDVGGVGLRVIAPASTLARIPPAGGHVSVHTRLVVREDSLTLYGFISEAEAKLFSRLVEVSGVGPRVAVAVLSAVTPDDFERAIVFGDSEWLTAIPGVGRKLAERMVVELKDKYGESRVRRKRATAPAAVRATPVAEAVEALVALGYSRMEAGQAVQTVGKDVKEDPCAEVLVRDSLKLLSKQD